MRGHWEAWGRSNNDVYYATHSGNSYNNYAILGENKKTGITSIVTGTEPHTVTTDYEHIETDYRQYVMQYFEYNEKYSRTNHPDFILDIFGVYTDRRESTTNTINTNTWARNSMRWVNNNKTYVVDIKKMHEFPFKFKIGSTDYYTIKYADRTGYQKPIEGVTATPMPTIDTTLLSNEHSLSFSPSPTLLKEDYPMVMKFQVTIQHFDKQDKFFLYIEYKVRDSHHMYKGGGDTVGIYDPRGGQQIEMNGITDWSKLKELKNYDGSPISNMFRDELLRHNNNDDGVKQIFQDRKM